MARLCSRLPSANRGWPTRRKSLAASPSVEVYFPVRKPRPSGEYATIPMPSSRQVGLLEETPDVDEPREPVTLPASTGGGRDITFDHVSFRYGDETPIVLPELDLDIPAGQTVALVGPTGAGKSTIAKLVARFYDPT